ncbi:MAG: HD domain-containing protein [Phycisphaerales bacterium]|nr:HD domain-containing protein [Phycisphaerales bacterium]
MTETYIHKQVNRARRGELPNVIARMPSGWAVMGDTQFLRGYALLLPDPVVSTLNDLDEAGRRQFLSDMTRLGDAVTATCHPRRINYEMLGNLEPALHAHVFPRYPDEPEDLRTKPVWLYPAESWNAPEHAFSEENHGELREAIRAALQHSAAIPVSLPWQGAAAFAARAHRHEVRKDGRTPYFSHPVRVALTIRDLFEVNDPATLAAALLHDTIEDTGADYDDLAELVGPEAAALVAAMTKDMRLPEARREAAYDAQLAAADWRARLLKLADVFDNLTDCETRTRDRDPAKMIDKGRRAVALARDEAPTNPTLARAIQMVEARIEALAHARSTSPRTSWDD